MSPPRSWLWVLMPEPPVSTGQCGHCWGSLGPARTGQPQPLTVYSQPLCACATDFHLVRTQGTEHRAEQDNIDFQSHISGRVVWLLSQDNHVQWGFLGVVQHVGQRHSEGPIIRREGPSILYTHITLGVHTQPPDKWITAKDICCLVNYHRKNEAGIAAQNCQFESNHQIVPFFVSF